MIYLSFNPNQRSRPLKLAQAPVAPDAKSKEAARARRVLKVYFLLDGVRTDRRWENVHSLESARCYLVAKPGVQPFPSGLIGARLEIELKEPLAVMEIEPKEPLAVSKHRIFALLADVVIKDLQEMKIPAEVYYYCLDEKTNKYVIEIRPKNEAVKGDAIITFKPFKPEKEAKKYRFKEVIPDLLPPSLQPSPPTSPLPSPSTPPPSPPPAPPQAPPVPAPGNPNHRPPWVPSDDEEESRFG